MVVRKKKMLKNSIKNLNEAAHEILHEIHSSEGKKIEGVAPMKSSE